MKNNFLLVLIALLINQISIAQQAWTMPKGKYYAQLGFTHLVYDGIQVRNQFEPNSLKRKVANHGLQAYGQYGITNKLMATALIPITFASSRAAKDSIQPSGLSDGSLNGLSNIQMGMTYKFFDKKKGLVLSTKLNTILPTATQNSKTGLRTGDNCFGIQPSFLIGYGSSKFFTSAEIGYVYRTNNYSGQTVGGFQIGKFFGKKKKLLAIFHTDLRLSARNGTFNDGNTVYTATYLNNLSYIAYGLKFGYKITPKMIFWSDIRFWSSAVADIGGRTNELGLFPGLSFALSFGNE